MLTSRLTAWSASPLGTDRVKPVSPPGTNATLALDAVAPAAKAGRGSVDALFALPAGSWLLGLALEFDLLLPRTANTVAVPFDALYAGSRIYVVSAEGRAQAMECANNGQTVIDGKALAILACPELSEGTAVVVTRIPNLVTGTKLKLADS